MQYHNASLERDRIPLSTWLVRLTDSDVNVRVQAGKVVVAISSGFESLDLDLDNAEFDVAVDFQQQQATVKQAIFDWFRNGAVSTADYLAHLAQIEAEIRSQQETLINGLSELSNQSSLRTDRIMERIAKELESCPDPERIKILANRTKRVLCASVHDVCTQPSIDGDQMVLGQAIRFVFSSAHTNWLAAPEILSQRLANKSDRYEVLQWIKDMGADGSRWLPDLIKLFEVQEGAVGLVAGFRAWRSQIAIG